MISRNDFEYKKIIIYVPANGDKLSFKNDNLVIRDFNNELKLQYSCYKIFAIYIVGGFTITTGLLERFDKYNITLLAYTYGFKRYATILNGLEGNTELRRIQYTEKDQLGVAKSLVVNKINSQIKTIKKKREKDLDEIKKDKEVIEKLNEYLNKIYEVKEISELMGYEGNASRIYFKRIFNNIEWKGRKPRIKQDIANFLLDISYTLLFSFIEGLLDAYGFDLYVANLHQEFYKRKSLVCDLEEPFRPLMDYIVRKMFNLGMVKEEDFYYNGMSYSFSYKEKPSINYQQTILEELLKYKDSIFVFIRNYYRWIKNPNRIEKNIQLKEWDINDINFL